MSSTSGRADELTDGVVALNRAKAVLDTGLAGGVYTGASLWIGDAQRTLGTVHVGLGGPDIWYDLASLTKPMVVASLAMIALEEGLISLDERIQAGPQLHELLSHRAGFAAHLRFDASWDLQRCRREAWETRRPGRGCVYSDLGYMVLGWHLEERFGAPLDTLVERHWGGRFRRLEQGHRAAEDGAPMATATPSRFLDTGDSPLRGRVLAGEVHDDNCWVLGGVAGHAGLFGRTEDVAGWAQDILAASLGATNRPVKPHWVNEFWRTDRYADGASWVLGFDTPTPPRSSAGRWVHPHAVGHLGFTGTSVWVDRHKQRIVVLLTNRVACGQSQPAMKKLRPQVHDAILCPDEDG